MTDVSDAIEATVQDAFTRAFTNFKGTFYFGHSLKSYGNGLEAGAHIQFDYAPDATHEEFVAAARDAANRAKSVVWEAVGLEAHWEGEVLKLIHEEFPGVSTEAVKKDARDDTDRDVVPASPPHSKEAVIAATPDMKRAMRKENAVWAKARYESHPNEFRDNRAKKAEEGSNIPDFSHTASGAGFYES